MNRHPTLLSAAFVTTVAVASALAQTKTVTSKGTEKPASPPPKKILVLVVSDDPTARSTIEDVIAGEVSLRGGNAAAAHLTFPDLPKERGPFEAKLKDGGFDAVMVSRLVGSEDKYKVTEGYDSYQTDYQGMDYWGGYWYTFQKVFVPGYLQNEKKVRVRTDLWQRLESKDKIVWSGTSETMNPRTVAQASREVGVSVATALAKKKLI